MTLANRCHHNFSDGDKSRGEFYFLDGMVDMIAPRADGLQARVAGSDDYYEVDIDWSHAETGILNVHCQCLRYSKGWLCKHIWATLLEMEGTDAELCVPGNHRLRVTTGTAAEVTNASSEHETHRPTSGLLTFGVPSSDGSPTARRESSGNGGARRPSRKATSTPAWQQTIGHFLQRRPGPENRDDESAESHDWKLQVSSKQREAWYVLDVADCVAQESLVIGLLQRESKKNGELGKIKPLHLAVDAIPTFSDPRDQQLLEQLAEFCDAEEGEDDYGYGYSNYRSRQSASLEPTMVSVPKVLYESLLPRLAETGRFVWQLDSTLSPSDSIPLAWDDGPAWHLQTELLADDKQQAWTLTGHYQRGDEIRSLRDGVMPTPTGLLLMDARLARLESSEAIYDWLLMLLAAPEPIQIPYRDREAFLRQLWAAPALPHLKLPKNFDWQETRCLPRPCLRVSALQSKSTAIRQFLGATVTFQYGDLETSVATPERGVVECCDGVTRVIVRDRSAEAARLAELGGLGFEPTTPYADVEGDVRFPRFKLADIVDKLTTQGWQVEAEGKLFRTSGEFKIEVQSNIDWFDVDANVDFDGQEVKLPELLTAMRKGEKYIELGDGSRGILPEQWLSRYARLADLGDTQDGLLRFKPSQALLLDSMLAEQGHLKVDRQFRKFRERLRSFNGVKARNAVKTFRGTLREYQQVGLGWFSFLQSLGLGGCLADDMGLGKTVQVLALLEQRRTRRLKTGELRRPSLVVVPKSLIFNWIDEAARFTPKLRVVDYTGTDRKQRVGDFASYHLIVTTYGTLRRDIGSWQDCRFDYAILDESQAIKNATSQSAKACQLLQADHRLALTGTPIENHLGELWSLFEFLNPGMLGRSGAFASLCKAGKPGERDEFGPLSRAVAPFMLRRTKQQVLKELPEKTEKTLYCDLLPKDRKAYNELRDFYRAKLSKKIDQRGLKQSKIHVLEALLRLRQAACHLGLVDKNKADQPSAKLDTLLQQLREVVSEGHKALVFSQFTSLLAIVRKQLEREGITYEYLDGKTRNRKAKVERFQTDPTCPLFLISLKAGGSGLNLTAASYVFILDPWWNPAVEAQAIDRTHRIGQTQNVFAYRIIARNTVEEKVLELQKSKRDLANAIIAADASLIRNLTAADLQLILS